MYAQYFIVVQINSYQIFLLVLQKQYKFLPKKKMYTYNILESYNKNIIKYTYHETQFT